MVAGALYCVIPAGGSGTRLWPISRAANPKFLHPMTGSTASLLQATVSRLASLSDPDATYVVTGVAHAAAVARQLPELPEANLLVEPLPRDSCAAIGLAAAIIARRDPDAIMGSFAADHVVRDEEAFTACIRAAVAGARAGRLMTIGITPTVAETGYGYLELGTEEGSGSGVWPVLRFKEKPHRELAEEYLASGRYLWNASMFVWRVEVFLAELERRQPELFAGLRSIADAWDSPEREEVLTAVWPGLTKISVDHAVMEPAADAGLVATVPGDFGWTDVGDFDTLATVLAGSSLNSIETDAAGNVSSSGTKDAAILLRDTTDSVIFAHAGRLVAALGMRGIVVVDTPDALLICSRDRAQDVKAIVDELKRRGDHAFL